MKSSFSDISYLDIHALEDQPLCLYNLASKTEMKITCILGCTKINFFTQIEPVFLYIYIYFNFNDLAWPPLFVNGY